MSEHTDEEWDKMLKEAQMPSLVSDSSQGTGWESWSRGWGYDLKLANGLKCTVSKSMIRGEGFQWSVFGLRGKKMFDDENEAKRVAEGLARKLLEEALSNLPNVSPLSSGACER